MGGNTSSEKIYKKERADDREKRKDEFNRECFRLTVEYLKQWKDVILALPPTTKEGFFWFKLLAERGIGRPVQEVQLAVDNMPHELINAPQRLPMKEWVLEHKATVIMVGDEKEKE